MYHFRDIITILAHTTAGDLERPLRSATTVEPIAEIWFPISCQVDSS